jgi:sugar phosphate permease
MSDSTQSNDGPSTSGEPGSERRSHARAVLSAWLCAGAIFAYMCRVSLAVAEKTIRLDLKINEETMGLIIGSFFWSYALFQIPGGMLGKKFGSRTWLPIFSALSAGATMLFGLATGAIGLLAARLGIGVAQAGLFPCSTIAMTKWFPKSERGLTSGFLAAGMAVGGAIGTGLTGQFLELTSWRWTLILYSIPGLLWAVGFRYWFRETPAEHSSANQAECDYINQTTDNTDTDAGIHSATKETQAPTQQKSGSRFSWMFLFARSSFWLICSQQLFRAAGAAFFFSWFATYLQETRDVSTAESGWLSSLPLVANIMAAMLAGGLSDFVYRKTGRLSLARSGLAGCALFLCSLLVFSAWFVQDATVATLVISAGAFCAAVAGPCAYASTMDMGGKNVALVFSWMNMVGNLGAGLIIWSVPHFRRFVAETPALLKLCGGESWHAVPILFATMFLLASACWTLLRVRENDLES